jgi:hypothetical protein
MRPPHRRTVGYPHERTPRPFPNITAQRVRDPDFDQQLLEHEHTTKTLIRELAHVYGDQPPCYGVLIDHIDPTGLPPGQSWKQCSLGNQCTVGGSSGNHLTKIVCVDLGDCPRCRPAARTRARHTSH